MKAINIIWDVDFVEELEDLPTEIEIPEGMVDEEEISNYVTDVTGFCHNGFELIEEYYYDVVASIYSDTCRIDSLFVSGGFKSMEDAVNYINKYCRNDDKTVCIEIEVRDNASSLIEIVTVG